MSENKRIVMMTHCPDKPEVMPHYYRFKPDDDQLEKTEKEYRLARKLGADVKVRHLRVVCNIVGCHDFADFLYEQRLPGIKPDYVSKKSILVDGGTVTCLCSKHEARLAKELPQRVIELEDRVDELEKVIERMHELFEYAST